MKNMRRSLSALILALILALGLGGSALADSLSLEGKVVPAASVPVYAAIGGTVSEVIAQVGQEVAPGDALYSLKTGKVYAQAAGTVTGVFGEPGDDAAQVAQRYGAVMYLEEASVFSVSASTDNAYNATENKFVHVGETVYLQCRSSQDRKGEGTVTGVEGTGYTVKVTAGSFMPGDSVDVFRDEAHTSSRRIGRGTVSRATPVAVKGSGSVLKIHVQNGDFVERGEVLFETVEGVLDGLYAPDNQVLSPTKGIVSSIDKNSGESLAKGDTLLKLVPSDSLRVEFLVQEADVFTLQVGQKVRMELYWDTEQGRYYEGEVTRISHIQETTTDSSTTDRKSYKAYASITPDERIRVGMSVVLTVEGTETAETTETADAISADGD